MNEVKERIDTAAVGLQGVRGLLADLLALEPGLLSAVLGQRAASIVEEHIDPALAQLGELADLTEAAAGAAYLRQLGARLDDLQRTAADVATLLEAAYGASVGSDVEEIRQTVGTITKQVSAITATITDERLQGPEPGE